MKSLILFLSLISLSIFCAQADNEPIFQPRPLLIFYDQRETTELFLGCGRQPRALLFEFMSALVDAVAPIIVTESLFHNFLNRKIMFDALITLSIKELTDWFNQNKIEPCIPDSIQERKNRSIALLKQFKSGQLADITQKFGEFYIDLLVAYSIDFTEKNWIVTYIPHSHCYLLIPRAPLAQWAPSFTKTQDIGPEIRLLPEEYQLGLKFQHYTTLSTDALKTWKLVPTQNRQQLFINLLSQLFITVPEYQYQKKKKKEQAQIPLWYVYIVGHGTATQSKIVSVERELQPDYRALELIKDRLNRLRAYLHVTALRAIENGLEYLPVISSTEEIQKLFDAGKLLAEKITAQREPLFGIIAGFSIPYVTHIIRFFNAQVATRFLMLSSCFAAGANLEAPYSWEGKPLQLNYTLVSHSLTEEPTMTFASKSALLEKIRTGDRYKASPAFKPFFDTLLGKTTRDPFTDAIAYVSGFFSATGDIVLPRESTVNNLSWIRVPGSSWFSFTAFREQTFMLNPLLTTRAEVEKLQLPVTIQNKSLILLSTSSVTIPLDISVFNNALPEIVSVLPGVSTHRFSKQVTVPRILKEFVDTVFRDNVGASAHGITKYFYFEKLHCAGTDFTVILVKNKLQRGKLINQVYQQVFDNDRELQELLYEEWVPGISTFGASNNTLRFLPKKRWQEVYDEFVTVEKSTREKLALTFQNYDELKKAYAAALRGSEQVIKSARIIEQYRLMRSKDRDAAEKYLSSLDQAAQYIIRQVFADLPSHDSAQVLDLRMRLEAIQLF